MTPFLKNLVEGGPDYVVKVGNENIAVAPVGDDEESLKKFQRIAESIIDNAGDGFFLHPLPHRSSDYAVDYYDNVLICLG